MLKRAKNFTHKKLDSLRKDLNSTLESSGYKNDICIVITGSYGRQEASSESDLDWYIIFDKDRDVATTLESEITAIDNLICKHIPNQPGSTATFGANAIVKFSDMQSNLGGAKDKNEDLTRRMLFLLEGNWLYNDSLFKSYQEELLKKYIKESDSKKLPRFLLNDIIRYYRTITTDFEFKVSEKNQGWGLRNIKLKFSRKLLYFSGILAVAELDDLNYQDRIAKAVELFSLTPLERIEHITENIEVFAKYDTFLEKISNAANRQELDTVKKNERYNSELYFELNELSQAFSKDLQELIKTRYPENTHSLQHALVF